MAVVTDPGRAPVLPGAVPGSLPDAPAPPPLRPENPLRPALRRLGLALIAAVPILVLLLLFCYPVATMIGQGFFVDGRLDLSQALESLTRPRFRRILLFTLYQASLSAGLCLLFGIPGAYLLYRTRFAGRVAVRAALTVPFVLPTVVVALAFRTLLAPGGMLGGLGLDGSLIAILAAHLCLNYAVVVRTVGTSWATLDQRPAQAAASLGASPVRVFLTVTVPSLGPAIAAAFAMVFLFCATSFGIMLIMGGARYSTLETEIYRQTADLLDLPTASALSVVQILLVTALLVVVGRLRRRSEATLRVSSSAARRLRPVDGWAVLVTAAAALAVLGPVLVMVVRSFRTDAGWNLDNYRALGGLGTGNQLLAPVTSALLNSLIAALLAAVVAVALGILLSLVLARRPRSVGARRLVGGLDGVMMLPLGVSAVTVGFGFLIALDKPPLDLRSAAVLVPLAQALVATPLVVRMVLPGLRSLDDRVRQAAAVLGAPPVRVWAGVDLPLVGRAFAGAAAFAFAVALGEFGATSFLVRPQQLTLPVVIGKLISRPGSENTGMALASATVLAALCLLVVAAVDIAAGARRDNGRGGLGVL